jgi:nicotinic acid phosphoribosyltransferase
MSDNIDTDFYQLNMNERYIIFKIKNNINIDFYQLNMNERYIIFKNN